MPLAKSITPKIINVLGVQRFAFSFILIAFCIPAFSQDNSPYSRYGLGDLVPSTNISGRGMGGISAATSDVLSINFNNPASYGSFQTFREATAKKMSYGRAILDVGVNLETRTLREPNSIEKFKASNALFSHVQVGLPLRPNWGLSFGLRPVSRISYKMSKTERLFDPNSGLPIDSAVTLNEGDGGTYLVSAGTGVKINLGKKNSISLGINGGYMFGKRDYSVRRTLINDTLEYNAGNFQTKTTYGNLYVSGGLQYTSVIKNTGSDIITFTLGAYGNLKQQLKASQDNIRETYYYDESSGYVRLDSVTEQKEVKGKITYPGSVTIGFVIEKRSVKNAGWLFGVDFVQQKWSDYRYYGAADASLRDKWELRVGAQLQPAPKANYFSNVAYRAGFFIGPDYIEVDKKLPLFGATFGLELPIRNYSRVAGQATRVSLAFEFIRRGNNDNLLKENMFRLSAGFSLSDLWFVKRKYD